MPSPPRVAVPSRAMGIAVGALVPLLAFVAPASALVTKVATITATHGSGHYSQGYSVDYSAGGTPPAVQLVGVPPLLIAAAGFVPDGGHHITLSTTDSDRTLRITDPNTRIISRTPICTGGIGITTCRINAADVFYPLTIWGSAGPDAITDSTDLSSTVFGGPGADHITGGPGGAFIYPGAGADDVRGGSGYDRVEFDSTLDGEPGPFTVSLDDRANDGIPLVHKNIHSGIETVVVQNAVRATLIGNDSRNFFEVWGTAADTARLVGGGGDDSLWVISTSRTAPVRLAALIGGGGNDRLESNAQAGSLDGGPGDDTLIAANNPPAKQTLTCGTGFDTAFGDALDLIAADCESVARS